MLLKVTITHNFLKGVDITFGEKWTILELIKRRTGTSRTRIVVFPSLLLNHSNKTSQFKGGFASSAEYI